MNFDGIARFLAQLSFREGLWLFPLAFTPHVLEELPRFTSWAQRYASDRFTWHDYIAIHSLGVVVSVFFPTRLLFSCSSRLYSRQPSSSTHCFMRALPPYLVFIVPDS